MCGRFALSAKTNQVEALLPGLRIDNDLLTGTNIAPTQIVSAIYCDSMNFRMNNFKWGLIPSWAKDAAFGAKMFNARAETIAEKPSFKNSFRQRRCLIPISYYYEWSPIPGSKKKLPNQITPNGEEICTLAGLWDEWKSDEGIIIKSLTIITCAANSLIATIHDRMPAIIPAENRIDWLKNNTSSTELLGLLAPAPDEALNLTPLPNGIAS